MSIFHCIVVFLTFTSHTSHSSSSFSFDLSANPNSSTPSSDLTSFGDAVVSAARLRLTSPKRRSSGRIVFKNPIRFFAGNPKIKASFSAYISFHIPNSSGAFLDFSLLPTHFPLDSLEIDAKSRVFGLEFMNFFNSTSLDSGIVSVKSSTDSTVELSVNSRGENIHCWIEYKAASNILDVRVGTSSNQRPTSPSLSQQIFIFHQEDENEVLVGLSCWNGNSTETCEVYSWSFKTSLYPQWLHSQPLLPQQRLGQKGLGGEGRRLRNKAGCFPRVIGGLVLGAGCGAVVATVGLLLWAVLVPEKQPILAEENVACPYDHGYEKIRVVLGKGSSSDDGNR